MSRGTTIGAIVRCILSRGTAAGVLLSGLAAGAAAEVASAWVTAPESQVRLVAGGGGSVPLTAGVEMRLSPGWKTYWRTPGDAGGVPPFFDFAGSQNVAGTSVLYPAPKRYSDKAGDTIGYKDTVTFPILVTPEDGKGATAIRLKFEYGICREICIPAEASLALDVPAAGAGSLPEALKQMLARVPGGAATALPALRKSEVVLAGGKPHIIVEAEFAADETHADAFVEAPDGIYVPMTKMMMATGAVRRFEIDLTAGADPADLKGKFLTVTLVGDKGQSAARIKAE